MHKQVPPGTMLYVRDDDEGGRRLLGELRVDGERLVVARGGEGGTGNASLKGAKGVMGGKVRNEKKGERKRGFDFGRVDALVEWMEGG